MAFILGMIAIIFIQHFRPKKSAVKTTAPAGSRYISAPVDGDEEVLSGPAWQVFDEFFHRTGLATGTCYVCRNGGVEHNAIITCFDAPAGPATAAFARVRIDGKIVEDLFVACKSDAETETPGPLKGSLWVCPVNWNRMFLMGEPLDPARFLYSAYLDIGYEEASRHGLLTSDRG